MLELFLYVEVSSLVTAEFSLEILVNQDDLRPVTAQRRADRHWAQVPLASSRPPIPIQQAGSDTPATGQLMLPAASHTTDISLPPQ